MTEQSPIEQAALRFERRLTERANDPARPPACTTPSCRPALRHRANWRWISLMPPGRSRPLQWGRERTPSSPTPWKTSFTLDELKALPDRLDNPTMRALRTFFSSPLPEPPACDSTTFAEALRTLVAILPRQTGTDEVGGKLMAAMYREHLGKFTAGQIVFLRDEAAKRCRWFPTIAECLEIRKLV